jgi:polyisoprenoid-binding protein YceI
MNDTNQATAKLSAHRAPLAAPLTRWVIDTAHATASFKVRHLLVASVRGVLGPITGHAWIDEKDLSRSRVELTIDATGLDTHNADRDAHLRGPDFFDVERFPTLTFRSTSLTRRPDKAEDGIAHYALAGELTLRGESRPVTLELETPLAAIRDPWGRDKRGVSVHGRLQRKDWGLTWNLAMEAGGLVVGDDVALEVELELLRDAGA